MGRIYRHEDKWYVQIRRQRDGQKYSLHASFDTRNEASVWDAEVEAAIKSGRFAQEVEAAKKLAAMPTFHDALQIYERFCSRGHAGYKKEAYRFRQFERAPWAGKIVNAITSLELQEWINARQDRGLSNDTVRRDISLLGSFWNFCTLPRVERNGALQGLGLDIRSPVKTIKRPPSSAPRDRRLSPIEETLILKHADALGDGTMGVIIRMGIDTSARRGEILKMEWHWLDLDSGTAFFPAHITKTKIERTVPLIERLRTSLRHHKEKVTEQLGKPPAGRVFPYTPDGFNANWTRIRQRARKEYEALRKADGVTDEELKSDDTVTGFRMHDCRHEATSRMMSAGLNIHDVKSVTGHSDLRSLSRYTHGNLAIAIKAVLDKHIKATTKKQKRLP